MNNKKGFSEGHKYYGICDLVAKEHNKIYKKLKNKGRSKKISSGPFVNTSEKDTVIFDSNF